MTKINWQVTSKNQKGFCTKKLLSESNILRYRNLHEQKVSRNKTDK